MGSAALAPRANRLLEALPDDEREALLADLRPVTFPAESVVLESGKPVDLILFPLDLVVSLVTPLAGSAVEVATIGNDGIVGVPLVVGAEGVVRALTPVGGRALAMEAPAFLAALDRWETFRRLVDRYVLALFGEISQIGACNRMHSNEERLSRWLLMTHDGVGTDTFPATHRLLGRMLGCRRASISNAAGVLQAAGFIRYSRGRMTILDRPGLESATCGCYSKVRGALDRVATGTARTTARGAAKMTAGRSRLLPSS
jgi:CRP-like cAMP-binding protein